MKIGVAVRKNEKDYFVHQSYLKMLAENGHQYDFITNNTNLAVFDGFLLPGGMDIDPKYYQEKKLNSLGIDEEMDLLDQKIIMYAFKNKKPLLGICRGLQSINVFLGGSLKQDILNHQNENHFIIYKNRYYLVNSFHHQSIKDIAPNFIVLATAVDGEIEIIKHQNLPIIGVQFHPELLDFKLINAI